MAEVKRIFVAGPGGMVGSAIARQLEKQDEHEVLVKSRDQLDLCDQSKVRQFLQDEPITEIYLSAAMAGGIHANQICMARMIIFTRKTVTLYSH